MGLIEQRGSSAVPEEAAHIYSAPCRKWAVRRHQGGVAHRRWLAIAESPLDGARHGSQQFVDHRVWKRKTGRG